MSKPNLQPLMSAATSLTLGMLSACSFQPLDSAEVAGLANHPVTAVQGSQACSESLGQDGGNAGPQFLDAGAIDLVVWNIHKTRHKDSWSDLASLAEGTELILLQEAPLNLTDNHNLSLAGYQSFAPGFRSGKQLTGVMTLSKTEPLTNCTLQSRVDSIRIKEDNYTYMSGVQYLLVCVQVN